MDDHVGKPIELKVLVRAIERALVEDRPKPMTTAQG